jgi:hypothetical protein
MITHEDVGIAFDRVIEVNGGKVTERVLSALF